MPAGENEPNSELPRNSYQSPDYQDSSVSESRRKQLDVESQLLHLKAMMLDPMYRLNHQKEKNGSG